MLSLQQVYDSIGADYKGVLERLPSEDFVRRFALKFLDDQSFAQLQQAMQARDAEAAFRAAHTLKGVPHRGPPSPRYYCGSGSSPARGREGVSEDRGGAEGISGAVKAKHKIIIDCKSRGSRKTLGFWFLIKL